MDRLPTGVCTFLFTDVEGSTRLWERHPEEMQRALELHDEVMRSEIEAAGGYVFTTAGDSFAVAFDEAPDAMRAAARIQERLAVTNWPGPAVLRVRMGLHAGTAAERSGDYFGTEVNRAARLMSAAHGGQIVISDSIRSQVPGLAVIDHGDHVLKDLSAPVHVYEIVATERAEPFPALRTLDRKRINLPVQTTPLLGREVERKVVADRLETSRLVTLCGLGGMGKTRLAIHVGADVAHRFNDGVQFVELAPVADAGSVPFALADEIGVRVPAGVAPLDAVITALEHNERLIVIDNCEHVLDAVKTVVEKLLAATRTVRILATSRLPLDLPTELVYPIHPLDVADDRSAAVQLFIERAAAANPSMEFDDGRLATVATLCRRIDGVPLAIVLAAARCRAMSPEDVARHLDDRFRLLRTGSGVEERHRILLDVVEWSYSRLAPSVQLLFRRLSVLAGPCTLDTIQAVCSGDDLDDLDDLDVLDGLSALVEHSLVDADVSEADTRYALLETMREFGRRLLGDETPTFGRRHAEHFQAVASRLIADMLGGDEAVARADLTRAWDDLRVAWWYAVDARDASLAARLVGDLAYEVLWRQRTEASQWAQTTESWAGFHDLDPILRIGVHVTAASGLLGDAGREAAIHHLELARNLIRDLPAGSVAPSVLAATSGHFFVGDLEGGLALCGDLLDHLDEGDLRSRFIALTSGSSMLGYLGRNEEATDWASSALELDLRDPSPTWHALARWNKGRFGGLPTADMLDRLVGIIDEFERAGNEFAAAAGRRHQVMLQSETLELAERLQSIGDELLAVDLSEPRNATGWMLNASIVLMEARAFEPAAQLIAWQERHRVAPIQPMLQEQLDRLLPELERELGSDRRAELALMGVAFVVSEAVDVAIRATESVLERLGELAEVAT